MKVYTHVVVNTGNNIRYSRHVSLANATKKAATLNHFYQKRTKTIGFPYEVFPIDKDPSK
jgi:hypothetical protein